MLAGRFQQLCLCFQLSGLSYFHVRFCVKISTGGVETRTIGFQEVIQTAIAPSRHLSA